jgi:hypothetical protein
MRPTNIIRTIAAVALLTAPAAVSAQGRGMSRPAAPAPTNDRDGYSVSLGLGGASAALTSPGAGSSDRQNSASGYLRLGKGFTPSVMLGVELNGWNKTEDGATGRTGMLSAIGQWYPSLTNDAVGRGVARQARVDRVRLPGRHGLRHEHRPPLVDHALRQLSGDGRREREAQRCRSEPEARCELLPVWSGSELALSSTNVTSETAALRGRRFHFQAVSDIRIF